MCTCVWKDKTFKIFHVIYSGILKIEVSVWSSEFKPHTLLKNLPPFFPTPVPARLEERRDLESGRHFNSFRTENKAATAGVTSPSFILLHDTTLSLSSSFQERITESRPSMVSNEHPSRERNFILLGRSKLSVSVCPPLYTKFQKIQYYLYIILVTN